MAGQGVEERSLEDDPTCGALLEALGLSPQEATVVVDGRPVPADAPLEDTEVTVVRLIAGG